MRKLESSIRPGKSDLINEDVWIEILKRVPIKTLGILRCVCNRWNSIIQSHYFLLVHHHHHQFPIPKPKFWMRSTSSIRTFPPPPLLSVTPQHFRDIPHPLQYLCLKNHKYNHPWFIVDGINGVVCMRLSCTSGVLVLHNPTFNKYARVPDSPSFPSDDHAYTHTLGFGFNKITHDLCLLNLFLPIHEGVPIVYELYSVKRGSWRKVVVVAPLQIKPTKYISFPSFFLNGIIHWVISESESATLVMTLLMFHCEREEFRVMPMPERFCEWITKSNNYECPVINLGMRDPSKVQFLFNYQGMLAFAVSHTHMCVMKVYGVESFIFLDFKEGLHVHTRILLEESLFFMKVKMPLCNNSSTRELKTGKCVPILSPQDNSTLVDPVRRKKYRKKQRAGKLGMAFLEAWFSEI